ncbi:MAG TPA: cyclic nucleotide-binding domain-containing protein [Solirubrobacteraceae bacterium]|nr:cyclic nucleotide-binding domain-containing protein [Solirubrobacteraceae bacterium]
MDEARLQQLPLFSGLSKRERKRIAPLVEEVDVEAGRELVREGDLAYELFVIEAGTAAISKGGTPIAELGPGDFFGEIALLDDDRRRTATVVASSPMRLAVVQGHDVRFIERELPDVARQIRAAVEARVAGDRER